MLDPNWKPSLWKWLFAMSISWLAGCIDVCAAQHEPMNILVLYADDWRHDTLGCAGNPIVKTPHLDRFAMQGVRFTHNYVSTSICGVSRASLFTGQWMSRHGNPAFAAFKTPWEETYPGALRNNGYFVGHVGKWHNGSFPKDRFDFGRSYAGTHWIKQSNGEVIHVTKKNEIDAIDFLNQRAPDKPFCLTVAFFATHAEDGNPKQYLPQPESMQLYQDVEIPVPMSADDASFHKLPPFIANNQNEGRNRWGWRFNTPERYQEMMRNYYRLATEVDTACGQILRELDRQGLTEKTLVVFTTDNGYFHAEHGLADKWYPYQESVRVPLIVRDPRATKSKAGTLCDAMTLNVDLAPTILQATGAVPPKTMQGRDLSPLYLQDSAPEWRQEYFYEHATIRDKTFIPASQALIRKDWKYIWWPEFEHEELFDLEQDPAELNNLANDPSHAQTLDRLRVSFQAAREQAR